MEENSHRPMHEESDVNVWAVGKFAIGLIFLCAISLTLLFGFFKYMQSETGGKAMGEVKLPPSPRLEEAPSVDLKSMRTAEDEILSGYGWVDQQKGLVRIPIARAMDVVVQRGLPARPESAVQAAATGVTVPTESSLGPKMQPPGGPLSEALK